MLFETLSRSKTLSGSKRIDAARRLGTRPFGVQDVSDSQTRESPGQTGPGPDRSMSIVNTESVAPTSLSRIYFFGTNPPGQDKRGGGGLCLLTFTGNLEPVVPG